MADPLIGASLWERQLYARLQSHVEDERGLIERYRDFARNAAAPAYRYLAELILAEEEQHHRLYADLAKSLRLSAELSPEQPPIPRLGGHGASEEERKALLALTERFLKLEEKDSLELDKLDQALDAMRETTLWPLLTRMMRMDNEKHIFMLRFLREHARRA